jgi:protein-tyrosine-phosphatase
MPSILFVCTANRFRSPLAAALFQRHLQELGISDSWVVSSAGTWTAPGQPVIPEVALVAPRFDLDLSNHRSTRVSRKLLSSYDLVIVMQASQKEALLTEYPELQNHIHLLSHIAERRSYDITDSVGSEREMMDVISELDSLLRRGLESICVMATYLHNSRGTAVSK